MSESASTRERLAGLFVLVIALAGLLPFLGYGSAVPLQPDSIQWIEKGMPGSEGWADWTFRSSHFVGYRPLTALSFTADLALFGPSESALRWTDLGLHALGVLAVGFVALRVGGPLGAVVAALWLVLHPATDEVVPFLARRSYPLAVLLAFSGFLAAGASLTARRSVLRVALGFLVGPLLLGSLFSNELGALVALALPCVLVGWRARGDVDEGTPKAAIIGLTVWGWAWVAAGVWVRQSVLAGDSGYVVQGPEPGRGLAVLKLYGSSLAGDLIRGGGALSMIASALLGVAALATAVLGTFRRQLLPVGIVLVLVAYGVVIAREAVWFPRQAYPAAALVGLMLAGAISLAGALERPRRAALLVSVAILMVIAAASSPMVRGTSTLRAERARVATMFAADLEADLSTLKGPLDVAVVAPVPDLAASNEAPAGDGSDGGPSDGPDDGPDDDSDQGQDRRDGKRAALRASKGRTGIRLTSLRVPLRWMRLKHGESDVSLRDVLYVTDPDRESRPVLVREPRPSLRLVPGARAYGIQRNRVRELPGGQANFAIPAPRKAAAGQRQLVWIYGGDDLADRLTELVAPAAGD